MATTMGTQIGTELSSEYSEFVSKYKTNNFFKIKNILSQNESYSKLIKWFYECTFLCTFNDKEINTFDEYLAYYSKNIVLSCSNHIDKKGKFKSCRKNKKNMKKTMKKTMKHYEKL